MAKHKSETKKASQNAGKFPRAHSLLAQHCHQPLRPEAENDSEVLVPTPTLVVLYGAFGAGYPESAVFLAWLKNVVDVAVQEHRDVRVQALSSLSTILLIFLQPDAPGKMVQLQRPLFGWLPKLGSQLTSHTRLTTNLKNIPCPEVRPGAKTANMRVRSGTKKKADTNSTRPDSDIPLRVTPLNSGTNQGQLGPGASRKPVRTVLPLDNSKRKGILSPRS
ncbi:hypothetical protein B0H16DRAFT_1476061 [Mycena metata]|uniref:Uncharacterized protein n=1 Tax=Mycena metata TaxID=1033252 RepID=A0AAD7HD18_9AGAR|nr:hypothetical protein B0H16DRAFT_1476061 [Mycena metata]